MGLHRGKNTEKEGGREGLHRDKERDRERDRRKRRMTKIEEEPMSAESKAKKLPGKEETARKVKPRPEKTSNGGGRL
ncbi:hypothetical protein ACFX15_043527 [Malus domestica]